MGGASLLPGAKDGYGHRSGLGSGGFGGGSGSCSSSPPASRSDSGGSASTGGVLTIGASSPRWYECKIFSRG